jgi:hypothetical protein
VEKVCPLIWGRGPLNDFMVCVARIFLLKCQFIVSEGSMSPEGQP